MRRTLIVAIALALLAAPLAFAAAVQVVKDRVGDAGVPAKSDLVRASMQRVAGQEVVTIKTKAAFTTQESPIFYIVTNQHTLFISGQSKGLFSGLGPGKDVKVKESRPAGNAIRWTFSAGKLGLKRQFRWYAKAGTPGRQDKLPNKGTVLTKLPG